MDWDQDFNEKSKQVSTTFLGIGNYKFHNIAKIWEYRLKIIGSILFSRTIN